MSIYLHLSTINDLHDSLEYALDITDYLDGVRFERDYLLRSKREVLAQHPELHPKNRAQLDLKSVQRGGALYKAGKRYVSMCRLLKRLTDEEKILVENRLVCMRFERDLRRHITADYEEGVNAGYTYTGAGH